MQESISCDKFLASSGGGRNLLRPTGIPERAVMMNALAWTNGQTGKIEWTCENQVKLRGTSKLMKSKEQTQSVFLLHKLYKLYL